MGNGVEGQKVLERSYHLKNYLSLDFRHSVFFFYIFLHTVKKHKLAQNKYL